MFDFIADIDAAIAALDFLNDPEALDKREELSGMRIAAEALIAFGRRHAARAKERAAKEKNPARKKELPAHRRSLRTGSGPRAPQLLGSPAALLVRPPGRHHRIQHLGFLQPRRLDQHLWPSTRRAWPTAR